jgi:signal transduction histidine kinase/CheY-like chemotaxis protein
MDGSLPALGERFFYAITGCAIRLLDPAGMIAVATPDAGGNLAVGGHFSRYYTDEDQALGLPAADLRAAANGVVHGEGWRLRGNGEKYWASVTLHALTDEQGALLGYAEMLQDASPTRAAAVETDAGREEAFRTRRLEALGQLAGGLAHDFNNILQGMLGSLQLAQRRIAKGEAEKALRLIDSGIEAGRRAAGLTHRLLAFARRQSLDPKAVDVNRLVVGLEHELHDTMGPAVTVELALSAGLPPVLCDSAQLRNALLSLAANAREAMAGGGALALRSARVVYADVAEAAGNDVAPGAYVCITVSDTGVGMPDDVLERAFDPFFTTKPLGYGPGLGLSMVHGFAKQSAGGVVIRSRRGEGTSISLYLPEHDAPRVEARRRAGAGTSAGAATEFVLVVDDDDMVRELVTQTLREGGYRAVSAPDATVALAMMRSEGMPDLLLTDVGLPGLNGRQLADAARELQPDLRVLFMTGYAANAAVGGGQALAPGMAILLKPFDVSMLMDKVRSMLDGEA